MTVSLPKDMMDDVERVSKAEKRSSHSELVREALRQYFFNNRSLAQERRTQSDRRTEWKPQQRDASHDAISKRAYELFLQHGGKDGHARGDWLQAEQEVIAQLRRTPVDQVGQIRSGRDRRVT